MKFFNFKIVLAAVLSAVFALSAATSFAGSGGGAGKANFQDLSIVVLAEGEGAPRPIKFAFSESEIKALNSVDPDQRPNVLVKMLRGKMRNEWAIAMPKEWLISMPKEIDISDKDVAQVLENGGGVVHAMSKGPKWSLEIKIVIKF